MPDLDDYQRFLEFNRQADLAEAGGGGPSPPAPSFIQALTGHGLPPQPPVPFFPSRLPTGAEVARGTMHIGRPVLEMGGLTAGGLLAAPLGPVAGVAGAGLGFAGGQALATGLEEALGVIPPAPVSQRILEAAQAVPTGVAIEASGQVAGRVVTGALGWLLAPFARPIAPAMKELAKQAEATGLDLTAAEIAQSKPLSLFESLLDKVPFSAGIIQRHRLGQLANLTARREVLLNNGGNPVDIESLGYQMRSQVNRVLKGFTGMRQQALEGVRNRLLAKVGSQETYEQLGARAQDALVQRSQQVADNATELFEHIGTLMPPGTPITTPTLQRTAARILHETMQVPAALQNRPVQAALAGLAGPQDPAVNRFLLSLPPGSEAVRQQITAQLPPQGVDFKTFQTMRSELGQRIAMSDAAFKTTQPGMRMMSSPEAGVYKQLKQALDADFSAFAETQGGDLKEAFDAATALYRQGKQFFNKPVVVRMVKQNPGLLAEILVRPGPGSVTDVRLVRRELGEAAFQPIRDAVSRKLLQIESGVPFSPAKLSQEMTRLGDATLSEVYAASDLVAMKALTTEGLAIEALPLGNKFFKQLVTRNPASVVALVVQPNQTRNIALIRPVIGDAGMRELRQATLERVLALNKDKQFSPALFGTELSRLGTTLDALFDAPTAAALRQLAALGRAAGGAEKVAGNPSGTAQNLIMFTMGGAVMRGITGLAAGRIAPAAEAGGLMLGPAALAKLYLSPVGRRYLSLGYALPATTPMAAEVTAKILGVLGVPYDAPQTRPNAADAERLH